MSRSILATIVFATPALASCSLLGLDDFDLPQCVSDEECSLQRNPSAGFYPGCIAFECIITEEGSSCEPIEGERCDGADNDCDHIVDEADATVGYAASLERLFETPGGVGDLSVSSDENIATAAWTRAGSAIANASGAKVGVGHDTMGTTMQYAANADPTPAVPMGLPPESASDPGLQVGQCRGPADVGDGRVHNVLQACSFAALAADRFGAGAFAAAVSVNGCEDGQLRVGYLDGEDLGEFIVRGPRQRSNSYLGVDLMPDGFCSTTTPAACADARAARLAAEGNTGDSRCQSHSDCSGDQRCVGAESGRNNGYCAPPSCADDASCGDGALVCRCGECTTPLTRDVRQACGVADVTVEALPLTDPPQALVASVSGSVKAPGCGDFEADVAVLPTFLQQVDNTETFGWVTAADEGHSLVLGKTLGNSAPALVALPTRLRSAGTLVGFGAAAGGVALHFVPTAAAPVSLIGTACENSEASWRSGATTGAGCCPAGDAECVQTLLCDTNNCLSCASGTPARTCAAGEGSCAADARFCCATVPLMCASSGPEDTEAACMDGCDNDGDDAADCADSGCAAFANCAIPCVDAIERTCMDYSNDQIRDCALVPPVAGNMELGVFPGLGGRVNDVAMVIGDFTDDVSFVLGVVWRELDTDGVATLVFRQLVIELDSSGAAVGVLDMSTPEVLTGAAHMPGPPVIAHANTGFVTPDFQRGGMTATEAERGGFYVAWSDGEITTAGQIFARRVAELDGRRIDADCGTDCDELLALSGRVDGAGTPDARAPRLYEDRGELFYLYADGSADVIVGAPVACSPSSPSP